MRKSIVLSDLSKDKKLTLAISIKRHKYIKKRPDMINVEDQLLTFKKMVTMSKMTIKILFLGSRRWTTVL